MFDNLIHELIHVLLTANYKSSEMFKERWDTFYSRTLDQGFSRTTASHIPVHALHYLVSKKYFGEQGIERIMNYSERPEYTQSWNEVQKRTPEKIISELFRQ